MTENILEINNIDVFYGPFQAIRNVSMKIEKGKTVGLFGPNGHGKTTILKAISGIQKPSQGTIIFEGEEITNLSPEEIVRRGLIHVPQGAHLFGYMNVKENLLLGAYSNKYWLNREEKLEKVYELFPRLKDREYQQARTLSGGERQMVAIGRGLMTGYKLLILDEPSMGLSPIATEELLFKLKEVKDLGMSILLVEQNLTYVTELCEYLYLVESAEIKVEGIREEMLNKKDIIEAYLGRKL